MGRSETSGGTGDGPEDEEELEGAWELDPNDPAHPDHDLSESAGYADWEPSATPWFARPNVILVITVLIVLCLAIIPLLYLI